MTPLTYGELCKDLIRWATEAVIGLQESQIPETLVLTPFNIERLFPEFQTIAKTEKLQAQTVNRGYLVQNKEKQVLFSQIGMGAAVFADMTNILCNCQNTKNILFVGTGGSLSDMIQTADINIPPSCLRLDRVLEVILPPDAPANIDPDLANQINTSLETSVMDLDITIHNQLHATVPFITCETKAFLQELQQSGVFTVDMELSVVYALANYYDIRAAGIILVEDLPLHGLPIWVSINQRNDLKLEVQKKVLQAILKATLF